MSTIAIMQPYFIPYAGYFRLFAAADLFVIYDCVQFPRRGWVHRNRILRRNGEPAWLTLPLKRAPRSACIADMEFTDDASMRFAEEVRRFPALDSGSELANAIRRASGPVVAYLERTLAMACGKLGLAFETKRSSALGLPPTLKGEERILEICRAFGAKRYVNAPGGRALYESSRFAAAGVELRFLAPYRGQEWSILQRLHDEPASAIASEITSQLDTAQ